MTGTFIDPVWNAMKNDFRFDHLSLANGVDFFLLNPHVRNVKNVVVFDKEDGVSGLAAGA